MRKLILYSDQIFGKTDEIDKELLALLGKDKPKMAYIPSCSDRTRKYYNQKSEYYRRLGIDDLIYFDIDEEFEESKIQELIHCDAIHLAGGDTSYFLSNIRKRNFDDLLKSYVDKGGILIGISAGSIIMTDTIEIIKIGRYDDDVCSITDSQGLGLVNFEFMPHWDGKIYNIEEFRAYTLNSKRPLYLCNDEAGIVVKDNDISFIGNILKIENGIVNKI